MKRDTHKSKSNFSTLPKSAQHHIKNLLRLNRFAEAKDYYELNISRVKKPGSEPRITRLKTSKND